jgi:thioredoxin reductase (NADPH)
MVAPDLFATAFPTLDADQVAALRQCTGADRKRYRDGDTLFAVGDRDFKFFVVIAGAVEIVDMSGDAPRRIATHGPGEFTGDVAHLTGNPAVATAFARGDCEVHEVSGDHLRRLLAECPDLSDVILGAFIARRQMLLASDRFTGLRVIGSRFSQDTFRVRDFLARNRVPFTWLDLEADPAVDVLLKKFGLTAADTPVVSCGAGLLLRNPSNRQLADDIGIRRPLDEAVYDLAIVGAGPAGLAAAVYGASEGLRTVVLERTAPGGQAGASMRIENYLGFPTGLTGRELADRATLQANKFGASLSVPTVAARLTFDATYPVLHVDGGEAVTAKCLLIATGADYRRLDVAGCERFEGRGVYYAATPNEVQACRGADVVVVGGGNSAGQAAVFLAGHAKSVLLVIRGETLSATMSSYLAHRIDGTANIELLNHTAVRGMTGYGHLAGVELANHRTGAVRAVETPAVFSFIGAVPRTDWLPPEVETDAKGFIRTGGAARSARWPLKREPFLLETSRPGVFAAGDVRAGSVKRVASAVGEGSMAVQFVHEYLKEM